MEQYLSPEGLEKIKKELEERKNVSRPQIAQKVKEAKERGDISENAEFDEAKELQAFNEGRIEELEGIIRNASIIDKDKKIDSVRIGATVKVKSKSGTQEFTIVGPSESNPAEGFISNESPLGQAFLGQKKGSEVEVETPKGKVQYKILEIH